VKEAALRASCGDVLHQACPMASWRPVNTNALQPASRSPRSGVAPSARIASLGVLLRRRACVWRASRRALETCTGAQLGLWLARAACVPFAIAGLYTARPLAEAIDAVVAIALSTFSVFAVLPALSAAGSAHATALERGSGLFVSRGITLSTLRAERWLGVAAWVVVHLLPLALIVLAGCAIAPGGRRALQLAALSVGVALYLAALGVGLGALAQLCHKLGRSRGQNLLFGLIIVPELLLPAWPELPTFKSIYSALLDACLELGVRV
jgi:hypothetical protein